MHWVPASQIVLGASPLDPDARSCRQLYVLQSISRVRGFHKFTYVFCRYARYAYDGHLFDGDLASACYHGTPRP